MQPRTLDAIMAELNPTYDPQIQALRQRQSLVPQSVDADIAEARGQQQTAFEDILGGARRRGLGFAGIPLGEQAKYSSTVFAPSVLRARTQGQERALSLEDAILGIGERRNTLAQQIRQGEITAAEQQRQFNENMAFQREQLAAQERARAASAAGGFSPTFNPSVNGSQSRQSQGSQRGPSPLEQDAYNDVAQRRNLKPQQILSDYAATYKSAGYGNARDKLKLQYYHALYPQLFSQGGLPGRAVYQNNPTF